MFFYLMVIVILFMPSIGYIGKKNQDKLLAVILFFLWFLATFRGIEIGNDTKTYYDLFKDIAKTKSISSHLGRYETGFLLLTKLFTYISGNFWCYLAVINIYIYIAYYKLIKRCSDNSVFSVALFFLFGIWGQTLNIIRLQLALASFIYAFLAYRRGDMITLITFVLLAFSFQRIALAYTFAFFIPAVFKKKVYIVLGCAGALAFVFLPRILAIVAGFIPYYANYLNSSPTYIFGDVKIASLLGFVMEIIIFLFGYIILSKNKRRGLYDGNNSKTGDGELVLYVNMCFVSAIVMLLALRFNLLDRCSYFFSMFSIIMIPNAIQRMKVCDRTAMKTVVFLLFVIYFLVVNILRPEWNHIYPYATFFS